MSKDPLDHLVAAYFLGTQDKTQSKSKKFEDFASDHGFGAIGKINYGLLKKTDHKDELQAAAYKILKGLKNTSADVQKFLDAWTAPTTKAEATKEALVADNQSNVRRSASTATGKPAKAEW